jgi:isoleucyl-tRNA synthetase
LSNLYDFDPAKHIVPHDKLTGLDRWILSEFSKLEDEVINAYDAYEFHVVYQKVSQFAAVELSAIYHDVVKDRLYTDAANSHRRRSTQTALHRMVTGLCEILAPILSFTTDEAWEFVPGKTEPSVHNTTWRVSDFKVSSAETGRVKALFELREKVLLELEKARQSKLIGKSLEAKVSIVHKGGRRQDSIPETKARWVFNTLKELLNVSQLNLEYSEEIKDHQVTVTKADGQKCARCWHWETDVGKHAEHPTICGRCVQAVQENLSSKA